MMAETIRAAMETGTGEAMIASPFPMRIVLGRRAEAWPDDGHTLSMRVVHVGAEVELADCDAWTEEALGDRDAEKWFRETWPVVIRCAIQRARTIARSLENQDD